ncbi:glycosyltransferase family 4 protein [Cupriavidus sp. JZ107]
MKLLTLFVRYGDADYPGAFKRLCQLYQRIEGLDYDAVLIDTALPTDLTVNLGPNIVMIGGDNSRREFSGWDTALARFPALLDGYDLVHIVTSAFENEYNGFYPYINRQMFDYAASHDDVVLAHIDAYPDAVRQFGRSFQTWGCSKFLIAVPERIRTLGSFVGRFGSEALFAPSSDRPFREDAPLSANYQSYLLEWLTGDGLPHGKWHSVFELSPQNLQRFQAKAISILDEHALSMRLRETGARIVDYTWLHSRGLEQDVGSIPDEIQQVQERNRYLFDNPIVDRGLDLSDHRHHRSLSTLFQRRQKSETPFGRTPVLEALWLGNRVLRSQFDLDDPLHCAAIHLNQGVAIDGEQRDWLARPDTTLPQDCWLPLTRGLHAIYLARDDLRASFDLATRGGRHGLVSWWLLEGLRDARYVGFTRDDMYARVDETVVQDQPLPITCGLHAICEARDDLREQADLSTEAGRRTLLSWWMLEGIHDPSLRTCMPAALYAEVSTQVDQDAAIPLTRGLLALRVARQDLRGMDTATREGRERLASWWVLDGRHESQPVCIVRPEEYAAVDPAIVQDALLPITKGLHAVCKARTDLRDQIDLATPEGRGKLVQWWIREGAGTPAFDGFLPIAFYHELARDIAQDAPLPITRGMQALHAARDDLREFADLASREGRAAFVSWWIREVPGNAFLAQLISRDQLQQPDTAVTQDQQVPITRAMRALYTALAGGPDTDKILSKAEGRGELVAWWSELLLRGAVPRALLPTDATLGISDPTQPGNERDVVHPLAAAAYAQRSDLRDAFDMGTAEGRLALNLWLFNFGKYELRLHIEDEESQTHEIRPAQQAAATGKFLRGGVNIVGFGRGELGIGEDVRMASLALRHVDMDLCVPAIPLAIGARQQDLSLRAYEVDAPLYNTNLVFLPHYETIRLLGATGEKMFGDRYNIGCWQWELPAYPRGMELALELVDEIWSSTRFTAEAMRGATDKPVLVMPMAVALPPLSRAYTRTEFGLPEDAFVFLNILDGNSSVHRKNPLAVIKAFQRAFPPGTPGVHLLFKTMNMGNAPGQWADVLALCRDDPRVSIISEAIAREAVIGLQSVCDCFVSLHRAEGFGRNIAEAMLLEKPVIASAFSGNTDFTNDTTAFMVGGEAIAVGAGEYAFAEGQHWWDADVESAASQMRRCVEDEGERRQRALAGKHFVLAHYSPEAVGRNYLERLQQLNAAGKEGA